MSDQRLPIEGKTPTKITVSGDELLIVCGDEAFRAYHMQDCCESVAIHDITGDLQSLVGKPITDAQQEQSGEWPGDVPAPEWPPESFTWTTQIFRAGRVRVVVRWLGTSNGYYSEIVHFGHTHVPIDLEGEDV